MAKVAVKTSQEGHYRQEINTGKYQINADAPASVGGEGTAPDPHELLLAALGACSSITMQMYAKRKGYPLKTVNVELTESKQENAPGQTTVVISKSIKVSGDLTDEQVNDLKVIADKCPVHKLLSGEKQINTSISHT